jgi:hypothetical protein
MEENHNTLKKSDDFWLCLKIAILSRNLLAVSSEAVHLIFTTRGHLAQRYQNWLLVYKQYKDPGAFFGICYENLVQI